MMSINAFATLLEAFFNISCGHTHTHTHSHTHTHTHTDTKALLYPCCACVRGVMISLCYLQLCTWFNVIQQGNSHSHTSFHDEFKTGNFFFLSFLLCTVTCSCCSFWFIKKTNKWASSLQTAIYIYIHIFSTGRLLHFPMCTLHYNAI